MQRPTYSSTGMSVVQKYLLEKNKLRSLSANVSYELDPIKTGCPPLDWVTDCGGFPRGRIVEISGPESSGKCVVLDTTFVPVQGKGILTMSQLFSSLDWPLGEDGLTIAGSRVSLNEKVYGSDGDPTSTVAAYYAGVTPVTTVETEAGHSLSGTPDHRVLILPENGIARWSALSDLRVGNLVLTALTQKVSGPEDSALSLSLPKEGSVEEIHLAWARLLGAMSGVEFRSGEMVLALVSGRMFSTIRQWAKIALNDSSADPFDDSLEDFAKFSGLAQLRSGKWKELAQAAISIVPGLIRRSSLTTQASWCAGLTLSKGIWTKDDLEFEISSYEVAKTLQLVMENLGVQVLMFQTLDTFAQVCYKVAIKDRLAQQTASELIWKGLIPPADWKKRYCSEAPETHDLVKETLKRARAIYASFPEERILVRGGGLNVLTGLKEVLGFSVDVEDTDKDNLASVAGVLDFQLRRVRQDGKEEGKTNRRIYETLKLLSSPFVFLDRVTQVKASEPAPTGDIYVPIGAHYAANGLVSHNSTLAMYLADKELDQNKNSVVVMMDYERSTTTGYARKMKLGRHRDATGAERFILVPSDLFEEADEMTKVFFSTGVIPSLWICDSVPAMVPKALWERDTDDNPQVAIQARLFSDLLARWVKLAADYGTTFVLINQIRAAIKIGFTDSSPRKIPGIADADKENTPGGNALRFYASLRLDLRPKNIIKAKVFNPMSQEHEEIPVANVVKATAKKNKAGSPFRTGTFYIQFGEGVDMARTLFDLALKKGTISKKGSNLELTLPDGNIVSARGQEQFIEEMKRGALALNISKYLEQALEWDRATEIHSQVLGLSVEDTETGEVSQADNIVLSGSAAEGKLAYVKSKMDLISRADALGLLKLNGRVLSWSNPETGAEFRGQRADSLDGKIKGTDRVKLQSMVEEGVKRLEEMVAADRSKVQESVPTSDLVVELKEEPVVETIEQARDLVAESLLGDSSIEVVAELEAESSTEDSSEYEGKNGGVDR